MDCSCVSSRSQSMLLNCSPHLHDILGYCKLAVHWIPHEISKVQQCYHYTVALALLDRYQREDDDFRGRIMAMNVTWARSYEPNLKRHSNKWKHPGSPRPKKLRPTQCAVDAMFVVAYDIDGVILHHAVTPRHTVNSAYYCKFLQYHLNLALRRKRRHLAVQNPIILRDNARSHIAAAGNGRLWNIHRTHPTRIHAITISLPEWNNHRDGPGTTQEMNLSVL